ncbi:MAG: hypothetical protein R3F11_25635 [Verrucomicrobiales bacterium]
MMRFAYCLLLSTVLWVSGASGDIRKVRALVDECLADGWTVHSDQVRIIATGPRVRLLDKISLPSTTSEEQLWEQYGVDADLSVVIRVTPLVSEAEFRHLCGFRDRLFEERVREWEEKYGSPPHPKNRLALKESIDEAYPLPFCHGGGLTVWFAPTYAWWNSSARPGKPAGELEKLRAALAEQFTPYEPGKRKPDGKRPESEGR